MTTHIRSLRLVVVVSQLGGCTSATTIRQAQETRTAPHDAPVFKPLAADAPDGLHLRLSEGAAKKTHVARPPTPETVRLSEAETAQVLRRLQPMRPAKHTDFAFPERSLPAPRSSKTTRQVFPPPRSVAASPLTEPGELTVSRFAPEGEVAIAPQVSMTFSLAMVPVTSQARLAHGEVPAKLEPAVSGSWRWVGAKTLLFEAAKRLPMATRYTVSVPAGTASATGVKLARATRWTFGTPAPQLVEKAPTHGPHRTDSVIWAVFDQRIDKREVLESISVAAGGQKRYALRLATTQDIDQEKGLAHVLEKHPPDRWLAFKTTEPLPADETISVTVGPGTPSLEGPRTTTEAQQWSFRTYSPLRIVRSRCGWGRNECRPQWPFLVEFNNPLDVKIFDSQHIRVEPELPGMRAQVQWSQLSISGRTHARIRYKVTIDARVKDEFGQQLGQDQTLSFKVGSAQPHLSAARDGFVVLDPAAAGRYSVFSVNFERLRAQIYKVKPADWPSFVGYMRKRIRRSKKARPPGERVWSKVIRLGKHADEMVETAIDLGPALNNGYGQVVVTVEHLDPPPQGERRRVISSWVQVTDIGLSAFADDNELIGWATRLKDGVPLPEVALSLLGADEQVRTDAGGLARLSLPEHKEENGQVLVARSGQDVAMLPASLTWWSSRLWLRREVKQQLTWYVTDDRGMYKPAETVRVKGWVRKVGLGEGGDVGLVGDAFERVRYHLRDARGNEVAKGEARLGALGGFHAAIEVPENVNLGPAALVWTAVGTKMPGYHHEHTIQIQEFRRPEFEVSVNVNEGPHMVGGYADLAVKAAYFAGGGLPEAPVVWTVNWVPGSFAPPGRSDFCFGTWTPWWWPRSEQAAPRSELLHGKTDAMGEHRLRLDFDAVKPPRAMSVTATATATDVNRQTWSARQRLLVHPAGEYVGLRTDRPFYDRGSPVKAAAIVTDLDGRAIRGRAIKMTAAHLRWEYGDGGWEEKEEAPESCEVDSQEEPALCEFDTPEGGRYKIRATIKDAEGRPNQSERTVWVTGGKLPPSRDVKQDEITLVPDRRTYQPRETARILVLAPFVPAEGVLSLRRSGIVETHHFSMNEPSTTLEVKIGEEYIPNLFVQVDLVGAAPRLSDTGEPSARLPKRPAFARGALSLEVPPLERTLAVDVTPSQATLEPGGKTRVDVTLKDPAGQPVSGAEVLVVVVDEAVLALTGYELIDPLSVFYRQREAGGYDQDLRASVLLANPEALLAAVSPPAPGLRRLSSRAATPRATRLRREADGQDAALMAGAAKFSALSENQGSDEAAEPIAMRLDFNPLVVFEPEVTTNAKGRAHVDVELPDNLTRYRVMAVAVSGESAFGSAESAITARLPVMLRPSAPRFLNYGDEFELPVLVQNQTSQALPVDVAVRAANAQLQDSAGRRVVVPANDRVEVRFPIATMMPGTARFQIGATSGTWADAAELELPVWTPTTSEAFATYGEIDAGALRQAVEGPQGIVPEFGGVEVTTSSTALQALTDAVLYVVGYRFACAEQISSRILAIAALRDVLSAFKAKGLPEQDQLISTVEEDLKSLRALQNGDGGFGLWRRGHRSSPFASVHVTHALVLAKDKGFALPDQILEKALRYLGRIEFHVAGWPADWARREAVAYATHVLHLAGKAKPENGRKILEEAGVSGVSMATLGWILPVLADDASSKAHVVKILRHLNNAVTETAATANFVTDVRDGDYLTMRSSRRADAVILKSLIRTDPDHDLVPKLVRGLLAHRKRGHWGNTQENVFVLLALGRYFARFEHQEPNFLARVWLGERFAGEHRFEGRGTKRQHIDVPMKFLLQGSGKQDLVLDKEGQGRLYYRIGMRYAPKDLNHTPADYGFTVRREYEAVDDPSDVRRGQDGAWHIKAGARVRVRITMVAPSRRYHVALVDPLPAGFEVLNPSLKVSGPVPEDKKARKGRGPWWWRPWFEHQNMRDERVEAFASLLRDGVHKYSYVTVATTPGRFLAPPPKAEEMYHPETFGRGATDWVFVE